jgi:nucleoside-diphosphate-sugar epimerase
VNKNTKPTLVITGSSGFVGQKLVKAALKSEYKVIGIDIEKVETLECEQLKIDLADEDFYNLVPKNSVIIHLASLSTDTSCKKNPLGAIEANLKATVRVVENANRINSLQLIFASSEWVYPEKPEYCEQFETDSLDLINLKSLYAISKLTGESLIRTICKVPYSLLRFGIIYGPRKLPGSAVESIAFKISQETNIEVGSLKTSRSFIYIDDLIEGILKVIEIGNSIAGVIPINISGNKLYSLGEIVEIVNQFLEKKVKITETGTIPSIRNPNIQRAREILGWEPKTNLIDGVKKCLAVMNLEK